MSAVPAPAAIHQDVSVYLSSDLETYWQHNSVSMESYLPVKAAEISLQEQVAKVIVLQQAGQASQDEQEEAMRVLAERAAVAQQALATIKEMENSAIEQWKQKKIEQGYSEVSVNAVAQLKLAEIATKRDKPSGGLEGKTIANKNKG